MDRFFNMDSPIMRFLSRLADLMLLNFIFWITCIPVFTIGASWTALSYVTLKMVRNEESYIARGFFKSFKQNFRQATLIWLGYLVVAAIFYMDFRLVSLMDGTMQSVMQVALLVLAILVAVTCVYTFPVLAKFENTIPNTIRNAFLISAGAPLRTVIIMVIVAAALILTFFTSTTFAYGLLVWILCGFALIAFINARFFMKSFERYIPESEN